MSKSDLRHYNNSEGQRIMRLFTDKWVKLSGVFVDFSKEYKPEIVEWNNDIIEVEYRGNIVNLDYDENSTSKNMNWLVDIKTDCGFILKNVEVPKPTISSELYKEICDLKTMIYNKIQNNIGNFYWKENEKKVMNELDKIVSVKSFKTFYVHNLIYKESLQNVFPLIWQIVK